MVDPPNAEGQALSKMAEDYSVDYPYEDMREAAEWFDHAPISEPDRVKIAYGNAQKLFRL